MDIKAAAIIGGGAIIVGLILYIPGHFLARYLLHRSAQKGNITQRALQTLGVVISVFGLLFAYYAFVFFKENNLGDALIFAGAALNFCVIPYLTYTGKMFTQSLGQVAADAVRSPLPLRFQLAIALCWLLIIGGFIVKIYWA